MEKDVEREHQADAAPNAYERVLAEDRRVVREALRTSRGGAHFGLVLTVLALGAVGYFEGPKWPLIIGGVFAVWFALAFVIVRQRGGRGWRAIERAYIATFGWAGWL
ncbi:hypothetical protein OHA37_39160 [Streptomyces sp. NBC_00335]|uniref:hypothetical protein n=1 Tax=unclassified Streptomyces TaxID=2593676 RepID=UPI002255C6FD|nr:MULTISPECIES: hypothetical protein [unclassified Streptomyces]MCX5409852.1 hypothetical protein [Streptomyces sp. NBC_00086]